MNSSKISIRGSDLNLKKEDQDVSAPINENKNTKLKKKKNIRQIYLKSVTTHNRNSKGSLIRTKNATNLENNGQPLINKGSSSYLTNEYNLVKKILNATKALERLKTSSTTISAASTSNTDQNHRNEFMTRTTPKYKTQEEYYEEILDLKKSLKLFENNDMITKAKMEYYENELSKKEQEILNLLDVKKNEDFRSSDPKSDLETINLKLKAYKLEFSLKRKDAELKKLKEELKTTSIKELKIQNDRLRAELSKALLNDKKILEAQEIKGMTIIDGKPIYEFFKSNSKKESIKQNIAKRLQKSENYEDIDDEKTEEFVSKFSEIKDKLVLKGSVKEKLEQLDKRETELLEEIKRLNAVIQQYEEKRSARSSHRSLSGSHRSVSSHTSLNNEKAQLNAIKTLQSVMKGHLERTRSLNASDHDHISVVKINSRTNSPKRVITPPFSPEPVRDHQKQHNNDHNHHHNHRKLERRDSELSFREHEFNQMKKHSPEISNRERRERRYGNNDRKNKINSRNKDEIISDEDDRNDDDEDDKNKQNNDKKKLIEERKIVEQTDTASCCSPWRSDVNAKSKKFF